MTNKIVRPQALRARTFTVCGSRIGSPWPDQQPNGSVVTGATASKFARSVYRPV